MAGLVQQISDALNMGNSGSWFIVLGVTLFLTIGFRFAQRFMVAKLEPRALATSNIWDDVAVRLFEKTKSFVVFVWIFYLLSPTIDMSPSMGSSLRSIFVILTTVQFAIWVIYGIGILRNNYLDRRLVNDASSLAATGIVSRILQAVAATIVILTGLKQLHVDIGALLAGLGVGGVAVALAAQSILGDLLASVSIVLDKPFVVGDFIVVDNQMGTVEYVGIKSTRVRSISGEQLVFPNKNLMESRIQNFQQMKRRRAALKFNVPLSTPIEKLDGISNWAGEIVAQEPKLKLDHCNFVNFGPGSYEYELAFFVSEPDANLYLRLQQNMLIKIAKKFKEEGIHFAFPTQHLVLNPDSMKAPHRPNENASAPVGNGKVMPSTLEPK